MSLEKMLLLKTIELFSRKRRQRGCAMNIRQRIVELISIVTLLVTLLIPSIGSAAEQKAIRKYPIPGTGALELNVPIPWKSEIHKPREDMPPTFMFTPAKGNDFQVTISVLRGKTGDRDFNSQEKVRTFVEKDGQKLLPNTAEGKIVLQEIKGVSHSGYYYSVTDKAPNPGEYRYMTRGAIGVGNLFLNFTILHRIKDSQAVRDGLSVLREAKQSAK